MNKPLTQLVPLFAALANPQRAQIINWLQDPCAHFPAQRDGDLVEDGVCVGAITDKTGLAQPTVTSHMKKLEAAGLVTSRKIKNWVFYRINSRVLTQVATAFTSAAEAAPAPYPPVGDGTGNSRS